MTEDDEPTITLSPLMEAIRKFKKRSRILTILMIFSMPASVVAIFVFLFLASISNFPGLGTFIFVFLLCSAFVSYVAAIMIPGSLSNMINQIKFTAEITAFMIVQPKGKDPQERALNQLIRTDSSIGKLVNEHSDSVNLNARIQGKSGKFHLFDLYIHHRASIIWKILRLGSSGINLFIKRFDDTKQVTEETIKNLKNDISDCLGAVGGRVPSRVLVISTSGFEPSVFDYINSKEGVFKTRFPSSECSIELIKENTDGMYDILSF